MTRSPLALLAVCLLLGSPAASCSAGPGPSPSPLLLPPALAAAADAVSWDPAKVRALIQRMPKAELHLHLDGSLSPATIRKLADRQGYAPFAGRTLEEIAAVTVVGEPRASLAAVLEAFDAVFPLLMEPAAVEEVAYDLAEAAALQNIRYLEARFAPVLHASDEVTSEQVLQAALRGLERGRRDFGVDSRVIVTLIRPFDFVSRERNEEMLALAVRYAGRGVVGIDLAGDEAREPLASYAHWFERARQAGLRLTAHAGETPNSADLATALALGVDRLGHAIELESGEAWLREVRDRGIPVEVNPTSNLRTGAVPSYAAHPARRWFESGIRMVISTDDPGVFAIDLAHEYTVLAEHLGFGPRDLLALTLQSVDAAFLPEEEKQALRTRFHAELAALLTELAR